MQDLPKLCMELFFFFAVKPNNQLQAVQFSFIQLCHSEPTCYRKRATAACILDKTFITKFMTLIHYVQPDFTCSSSTVPLFLCGAFFPIHKTLNGWSFHRSTPGASHFDGQLRGGWNNSHSPNTPRHSIGANSSLIPSIFLWYNGTYNFIVKVSQIRAAILFLEHGVNEFNWTEMSRTSNQQGSTL